VQASGNTGTLQWLLLGVLLASCHETRHLILGKFDLTTTEGRETEVSDLVLGGRSRHFDEGMNLSERWSTKGIEE
jgi:hypothetical protein